MRKDPKDIADYEATFAELERLTGFNFRTIRKKLHDVIPTRSDSKSDYYRLKDILPILFTDSKNEKERATIAEIKARTRNWIVTADRSEIKKRLEESSVYNVEDVNRVISKMLQAFKNKVDSLPSRIAVLDKDDYHGRLEISEQIISEALKEINQDAIRQCKSGDLGAGEGDSEAHAAPVCQ